MQTCRYRLKANVVDAMVRAAVREAAITAQAPLVARAIAALRAALDGLEVPVRREEVPHG